MADPVFRPTYHAVIPADATFSTKKGVRMARFRLAKSGKYVTGEVMPSGKARIESPLYFARIRRNGKAERVATGVEDKEAALAIRERLQRAAEQQRAGIIDPMAKHRGIELIHHIEDYQTHLVASGFCKEHTTEMYRLLLRICKACHFRDTDELAAGPLNTYLAGLLRNPLPITGAVTTTNSGSSVFYSLDVDETEEDVKTSAGILDQISITNRTSSPRFVKLYNLAAASVTVGSTTPLLTIPVPAAESGEYVQIIRTFGSRGLAFSTALSIAATTGLANSDTGAPGTNDVVADCIYR